MDKIIINDINTEAIIGVYQHERIQKQPLNIDLELVCDLDAAGISDNLNDSIDYELLTNDVRDYVTNSKFQLLEALAKSTIELLIRRYPIEHITIKIHKPNALKGASVIISMARKKEYALQN